MSLLVIVGPPRYPRLMLRRRFPIPWTVEERGACFIVHSANWQSLGYFYFKEGPGRSAASMHTRDEARPMAVNFAKLPGLLRGDSTA